MQYRKRVKFREELKGSWFIPLRLSIFLLLFGAVVLAQGSRNGIFLPFLLYSSATVLFVTLAGINSRLIRPGMLSAAIFLQIALELVIEGSLTHVSGQLTSQLSILFLLTIISASLAYRLPGTLAVASMASLVYSVQTSAPQFLSTLPLFEFSSVGRTIAASDDIFYAVFLHVCTFYLVAFISGYLVEKLRLKEGELSSTSRRLERARLDTDDILLNLHSGILTIDNHGDIVYFNRAAESILGLKEADVRGRSFMQAFNRRMPEFTERILSVLKLAKPSIRSEIAISDEDGATVPIGLTTSLLGDEQEGIRGVIAVFQDLTSAKKLENALMNANRLAAVGEISARIAHEIRNPLASISGSVEVLKSELRLADENQRLMDLIVKESERLSRILTNFLSYARNQPALRSKVELVSLVGETIELLRHDAALPEDIEMAFHPEIPTAYVVADEDQLKQVIINLITNAAEAIAHPGGKVELAISEPATWSEIAMAEWIELQVIDNGQGFAPEDKGRIFEPFFSHKRGGTGLGLAIVRRCLDNLGARIKVDTSPKQGTTFSIIFRRYLATSDHQTPHLEATAQD